MIPLTRAIFFSCLFFLFCSQAFAGDKDNAAARALVTAAFQKLNVWSQGPIKLVADVRILGPNNQELKLKFEISWVSPGKWLTEWSGAGYSQIRIHKEGRLYLLSNIPTPPIRVLQFESALEALDGAAWTGPLFLPSTPSLLNDRNKGIAEVSKKKLNGIDAQCVKGANTVCLEPQSGRILSIHQTAGDFEYSDYLPVGNVSYPGVIRISYEGIATAHASLGVTEPPTLAEELFTPPEGSKVTDLPSCSAPQKGDEIAHLDKKVQPQYPLGARNLHEQGTAWLYARVDKDGAVQDVQVVGIASPVLDAAALDAVRRWKYTPYISCGQPAPFDALIGVNFTLRPY